MSETIPEASTKSAWKLSAFTIPAVLAAGLLSGRIAGSGPDNIWFAALEKPLLYPPPATFGIVWTILYIMLGIVLARLLSAPHGKNRRLALLLFAAQLAGNLLWSSVFFAWHLLAPSFFLILLIGLGALAAVFVIARLDRLSAWLMVPYLVWISFAAGLAFRLWQANGG